MARKKGLFGFSCRTFILKVGDRYKERNKLYQIDLITDNFVILSAVHGDLDDGMIIRLEEFEAYGLKKVEGRRCAIICVPTI